ncbi:hypothetical protein GCM10022393_37550 [Aquimarina addita]|uniref:DUF1800 domain-containing protein n=1 Tax=Aquimarina addita TaxID=870485 RepID=A0ABP6UVS1_9FLAO
MTCNFSGLAPYIPTTEKPWNAMRAKHFYRRFGFGGTPDMIKNALTQNPSDLVDDLIGQASVLPTTPDPGWGYLDKEEGIQYVGEDAYWHHLRAQFLHMIFDDLRKDQIRGRMTMFMHGLFVSRRENNIPYMYQSYLTKQKYAVGNFKDFIHDMGLDACMIRYLNNYDNKAGKPNENYARELYELFTLGVDNGYTENDIKETARAFTGYNTEKTSWGVIEFNKNDTFDDGEKTIFGQTGNWGYSDVINILFDQKPTEIATYICTKLYEYFVSYTKNEDIIAGLAQTFLENNYELAPVLSQLFKSEHFFDEACIGVLVKSPLDLVILHDHEVSYQTQDIDGLNSMYSLYPFSALYNLEMDLLRPPNVSGWIEHKAWINSVSVSERISRMQNYSRQHNNLTDSAKTYINFAKDLFDIDENVEVVARGIVDFCLSKEIIYEPEYQEAISVFKEGVPDNYFNDGIWNLNYPNLSGQVKNLIDYIFTIPEFQLK